MIALPWQALRARVATRSVAWARRRQGADAHYAELHPRRIYILPTRAGIMYGLMAAALLLSSMNFSNNMGFALTFLLAAVGLISMHHCQGNLNRLRIDLIDTHSCFAGESAGITLQLRNLSHKHRWQLQTDWIRNGTQCVDLEAEGSATVTLQFAAPGRGVYSVPRISVSSAFPFGLCRAWSWMHLDATVIVWPQPAPTAERPATTDNAVDGQHANARNGDDLSGVRDYQTGDLPQRIDWKGYARHGELRVREYRDGSTSDAWLDWAAMPGADPEQRLALLARLALDAHAENIQYGLRLPATSIEPGTGEAHLHECLNALALHGTAGRTTEPAL